MCVVVVDEVKCICMHVSRLLLVSLCTKILNLLIYFLPLWDCGCVWMCVCSSSITFVSYKSDGGNCFFVLVRLIYDSTRFFSFFFFKKDGVRRPFFFFLSFLGEPSVETSYENYKNENINVHSKNAYISLDF